MAAPAEKAAKKSKKTKAVEQYYGTGRRKTSVARVFLRPGKGDFVVNKRPLDRYFDREILRILVNAPLKVVQMEGKFDIYATVKGGGNGGQAGAVRHGLARALIHYDDATTTTPTPVVPAANEEDEGSEGEGGEGEAELDLSFRRMLRRAGFVTRDARKVERKKVGLHKARKATQYSKR